MSARRPSRAGLVVVLVTALVTALVAAGGAVGTTSAAWADPVHVRAAASAGTWTTPSTCAVRNADGTVDASKPCTVVPGSLRVEVWSGGPSGMQGNAYAVFSAPGIVGSQYVSFDVTLPDPANASWSWTGAGIGNANGATVTSACSALPRVTGRLPANLGDTPGLYLALNSPRSSNPVCTLP